MQTPQPGSLKLSKETNLFSLTGQLSDDRLLIILKDYKDWVIYQKQYTEQHTGKQIHKKLQLIDVYSALCQIKNSNQSKNQQQNKYQIDGDYEKGIVASLNKKSKYRIEKDGRITTYTEVYFKRNGVQVQEVYECKLKLDKKEQMKQMDIFIAKAQNQKRDIVVKFQAKIQEISNDNIQIRKQLMTLENQIKKLNLANEKLTQQLTELIKLESDKTEQINQMQTKIKQFMKLSQRLQLDSASQYHTKFAISGKNIIYVGQPCTFTQFIMKEEIPHDKIYKFRFKIIRSTGKNIMIGIIDFDKQVKSRSSYDSQNAWVLYGCGQGYKYPGSIVEGKGFNVGDIVEVQVRLREESITWNINNTYNSSFKGMKKLSDSSISFRVYGELWQENQCVSWLGSSISDY